MPIDDRGDHTKKCYDNHNNIDNFFIHDKSFFNGISYGFECVQWWCSIHEEIVERYKKN